LLGVAIRASGSIGGERDRQTLDTLLTTPVENDSIVWSKWWGSILGVRKGLYMLLALWILGVVTTGVSPLAVPLLLLAWLAYAGFVAGVGMFFSLHCRTTLRATIWTMITVLSAGAGHWLLYLCCCGPFMMVTQQPPPLGFPQQQQEADWTDSAMEFQKYALTPPVAMYWLTFRNEELRDSDVDDITGSRHRIYQDSEELMMTRLTYCLIGMAIYGLTGGILLLITRGQFGAVMGRLPLTTVPPKRRPSGQRKPVSAVNLPESSSKLAGLLMISCEPRSAGRRAHVIYLPLHPAHGCRWRHGAFHLGTCAGAPSGATHSRRSPLQGRRPAQWFRQDARAHRGRR
jgi:ABC-type transport system involved in multi-copper enzyme maturation permease subunit